MSDVIIEVVDGVGRVTLNRPRAINALTLDMLRQIDGAVRAWADDPEVTAVELHGAGERGLCSGADVRAVREQVLAGEDYLTFFDVEYAVDAALARYPKPYTVHMHGITMGGGLGLSAHASRRLVAADSRLAMPETNIGFSPDAGVLWELTRAPGLTGLHLALTSASVGAADAVWLGLADEVVGDAGPLTLAEAPWIEECYSAATVVETVGRLGEHPHPDARAAAAEIRRHSPFAVSVAWEAFHRVGAMASIEEVFEQDLRLIPPLIGGPDFAEGVRAHLVDKDRSPQWLHRSLEEVDPAAVAACFAR